MFVRPFVGISLKEEGGRNDVISNLRIASWLFLNGVALLQWL